MMQAMIFAAGLGTRLKPLTDFLPKALVRVGGETLLKHVIFRLKEAQADKIVINVHHFSNLIVEYLDAMRNFGMDIHISDETAGLLETGGGIKKAWNLLDAKGKFVFNHKKPVLIHNVDILSNVDLQQFYELSATPAARLLVSERTTNRYLLFDETMRLVGWTNTSTGEVRSPFSDLDINACQRYAFSGIHCLMPQIFPLMENEPDCFPIMDFYLRHCGEVRIEGLVKKDLKLMDVGKQETLKEAEAFLKGL